MRAFGRPAVRVRVEQIAALDIALSLIVRRPHAELLTLMRHAQVALAVALDVTDGLVPCGVAMCVVERPLAPCSVRSRSRIVHLCRGCGRTCRASSSAFESAVRAALYGLRLDPYLEP